MGQRAIAGIALLLGGLSLGGAGRAQEGEVWGEGFRRRGERPMRLMAMLENERVKAALGLTDQQADRLRQIRVDAKKSSVRIRADMAIQGLELRELLRVDKPDREVVMKKVQEISDLRRDWMKQHIDALLAAKNVLTSEQQKKLRTYIESRRGAEFFGRERFPAPRSGASRGSDGPGQPPLNPDELPGENVDR